MSECRTVLYLFFIPYATVLLLCAIAIMLKSEDCHLIVSVRVDGRLLPVYLLTMDGGMLDES